MVGGSALFGALTVSPPMLGFALPATLGVSVLWFFVLHERETTRCGGWLLLILYVAFTVELHQLT